MREQKRRQPIREWCYGSTKRYNTLARGAHGVANQAPCPTHHPA
eukprot:COSAG04_NODE_20258_length_397_cov_1.036913_1_plen_43_part_10